MKRVLNRVMTSVITLAILFLSIFVVPAAAADDPSLIYQMGDVTIYFRASVGVDNYGIYMELNGYMPQTISETISGDFTEKELQKSFDNLYRGYVGSKKSCYQNVTPMFPAPSIYSESSSDLVTQGNLQASGCREYYNNVYMTNRTLTNVSYSIIPPGDLPVEALYIAGVAQNARIYDEAKGNIARRTTHHVYMDGQLIFEYSFGAYGKDAWFKIHDASFKTESTSSSVTATPTTSKIFIDGKQVDLGAYLINDNNYVKLRDIAYLLDGSPAQFNTVWHQNKNLIEVQRETPYVAVGGEMKSASSSPVSANLSTSQLMYEYENWGYSSPENFPYDIPYTNLHTENRSGQTVYVATYQEYFSPRAYNIDGNNYYKLRDIAHIADFTVDWDAATSSVLITTVK